jgi:hypothetical protein
MTAAAVAVRERPILMSGPMVRAVLADQKTQTRRVVSAKRVTAAGIRGVVGGTGPAFGPSPYGDAGDRLWLRETFALTKRNGTFCDSLMRGGPRGIVGQRDGGRAIEYAADERISPSPYWLPSIHMPRWASRITLEITNVRVERLVGISEADAVAEGAADRVGGAMIKSEEFGMTMPVAVYQFAGLWNRINAKRGYGWDVNPWVWVLEFKRVTA